MNIIISGTLDDTDKLFACGFCRYTKMKRQPFGGYLLEYESKGDARADIDVAWKQLKEDYPDDCDPINAYAYALRDTSNRVYFVAFHNAIAKIVKPIN
jgi:hypothetical protein